jgi:hypothetical protein
VDGSLDAGLIKSRLNLDPGKPTVLYAPTWSPHSSLNAVGEDAIKALAGLDVNVIVKLHDRSREGSQRGSGGIDWPARLRHLCGKGGVHLADGPDACPYLFASDVLVTDHSSVGFEFMLLDRPIVVVHSPELLKHGRVNLQKADLLQSAARVVESADSAGRLASAVLDALAHPTRYSAVRRAIASDLFYRPGGATTRAVQCIYEVLALPALHSVAVGAPHPANASVPLTSLEMGARQT